MDYALRIVVEKVAISSQEVIKRDTITSYALQCPTSIGELGLRHAEQIALLEKVQNTLLAEQSLLLDPEITVCPTCGNTLKKNGYKASNFGSDVHELVASFPECQRCAPSPWWRTRTGDDDGTVRKTPSIGPDIEW